MKKLIIVVAALFAVAAFAEGEGAGTTAAPADNGAAMAKPAGKTKKEKKAKGEKKAKAAKAAPAAEGAGTTGTEPAAH